MEDLSPLDRLALVGRQGRGAMTFLPKTALAPQVDTLDLDALAAEALVMLAGDESQLAPTLHLSQQRRDRLNKEKASLELKLAEMRSVLTDPIRQRASFRVPARALNNPYRAAKAGVPASLKASA